MYTLFIDTHFQDVVIVLYKDGTVYDKRIVSSITHSTVTMPLIAEIIKDNSLSINDLGEIFCINGPGSFTGVRIGVTIAKMLSLALSIPIKCVDYLEVMHTISLNNWVAIVDKNGAFVGHFKDDGDVLYSYYNKLMYNDLKALNNVCEVVDIDYDKLYIYISKKESLNPHVVNPVYVKNIEVNHG